MMKGVNRRVFWRCFFLETLWNYDKMQNIGFLFCIYPALQRIYNKEEELRSATGRHLEYVNTNPPMGPMLAGMTARMECDFEPTSVIAYRKTLMGALAGFGDSLFWGNLRPFAAVCGVLLTLGYPNSLAGPAAMLVIYNVPNLYVRSIGFSMGWTKGLRALLELKLTVLASLLVGVRRAVWAFLGIATGLLIWRATQSSVSHGGALQSLLLGTGLILLGGAAYLLLKKNVSSTIVVYISAVGAMAIFFLVDAGIGIK